MLFCVLILPWGRSFSVVSSKGVSLRFPAPRVYPVISSSLCVAESNLAPSSFLSEWYASSRYYGVWVHEDERIRSYVQRFWESYRSLQLITGNLSIWRTHGRIFISFLYTYTPEPFSFPSSTVTNSWRTSFNSLASNYTSLQTQYSYASFRCGGNLCSIPKELHSLGCRWRLQVVLLKEQVIKESEFWFHRLQLNHPLHPSRTQGIQHGLLPPGWQLLSFSSSKQIVSRNILPVSNGIKLRKKVRRSHAISLRRFNFRTKCLLFHFMSSNLKHNRVIAIYSVWRRLIKWQYLYPETFKTNYFRLFLPCFCTKEQLHRWWQTLKKELRIIFNISNNDISFQSRVQNLFQPRLSLHLETASTLVSLFQRWDIAFFFLALKSRQHILKLYVSSKVVWRRFLTLEGFQRLRVIVNIPKKQFHFIPFLKAWAKYTSNFTDYASTSVGFSSLPRDSFDLLHRYLEYLTGCQIFLNYQSINSYLDSSVVYKHSKETCWLYQQRYTHKSLQRFQRMVFFESIYLTALAVLSCQQVDISIWLRVIVSWFKRRPRSQGVLFRFLTVLFPLLLEAYGNAPFTLQRIKFAIRRRLARSPRKKKRVWSVGQMPLKTQAARIYESRTVCRTSRGVFSFRLWVYFGVVVSSTIIRRQYKRTVLETRELKNYQKLNSLRAEYLYCNSISLPSLHKLLNW